MIGAVVRLEWLLRARRDGFSPLLSCYFACLLLDGCAWYYPAITGIFLPPSPARDGRFLMGALEFLWFQQWLLPLLLAAPFLAGAFTGEKANRILPLLFTTPCTSAEMILGKFLARVFPLLLLGLAHWPFWGLLAGLVGIDPLSAGVLAVASLLPILGVSAVSQLASVCCAKHSDAVVASYVVLAAGTLCIWQLDAAASS
jgi:ABC-type transport system involved in multi-copper enzyme maturation permease subunit